MGANATNHEIVVDYTSQKVTYRLHLELLLDEKTQAVVRTALDTRDAAKLKRALKDISHKRCHGLIDAITLDKLDEDGAWVAQISNTLKEEQHG